MKSIFTLIAGIVLSGNSFAASAPFCLSFAALKMNPDANCDDNYLISKKADSCLSLYTNDINAGKAKMDAILKSETAKGKAEQSDTYKNASSVFDQTMKELDRLIANGEVAKLAVKSYQSNLSLPEDYDQPQLTRMTTERYLQVEPCFATPKRIIDEDVQVLELMVDDLKKTKAELLAKGGTVQGQSSDMSSMNSMNKMKNAPAAPATPKGTVPTYRDSGVSGYEESESKQKKAK